MVGLHPDALRLLPSLPDAECSQEEASGPGLRDQQVLSVRGYSQLFSGSVETLRAQLADKGEGAQLVWDKVSPGKLSGSQRGGLPWAECPYPPRGAEGMFTALSLVSWLQGLLKTLVSLNVL